MKSSEGNLNDYVFLDAHVHNLISCFKIFNKNHLTLNPQKLRNNVARLFSLGLSAVFTDHGTLEPYKALQRNQYKGERILDNSHTIIDHGRFLEIHKDGRKLYIICGEEFMTRVNKRPAGHILAFGLKEAIKDRMTPHSTIEAIKAQKGIVIPAHLFFVSGLRVRYLKQFYHEFDAVELTAADVFNIANKRAIKFIRRQQHVRRLNYIFDSDAHLADSIGKGFWGFPKSLIEGKTDTQFISNLKQYLRDPASCIPCNMGRYKFKDVTLHYPRKYMELIRHYNGRKVRH
ncbi:hypothetical protein HYV81_05525 [Candidatus Woesearchaeota archaeon]|nr:hypothetical protein [Candidatus Woesearchaeota archaeon]